jgi:hypothetical protein
MHPVLQCNSAQSFLVDLASDERRAELIEVAEHRRRRVEVQLAAGGLAHAESVDDSLGNVNEGACRTGEFFFLYKDDVLALEYVESLVRFLVDMQRWAEVGRLLSFEKREGSCRIGLRRFDRNLEASQVDRSTAARCK